MSFQQENNEEGFGLEDGNSSTSGQTMLSQRICILCSSYVVTVHHMLARTRMLGNSCNRTHALHDLFVKHQSVAYSFLVYASS